MSIEKALGQDPKELHRKAWEIKHGTPLQWEYPKYWGKYFSFTTVRNPWDRLVSTYFYDLSCYRNPEIVEIPRRTLIHKLGAEGFGHYVKNYLTSLLGDPSRIQNLHYSPQINWFKNKFDYVCRFENFQSDFDQVCRQTGMQRQELPHLNRSSHKNYAEYYDNETRKLVANIYAKDIKEFGYEFGKR